MAGPLKLTLIFVVFSGLFIAGISAETTLSVEPGAMMAIGRSADNFGYGGNVDIGFDFHFSPAIYTRLALGFDFLPINLVDDNLFLFSAGLNVGAAMKLLPFMKLNLYGGGGYYYGLIDPGTSGSDPYVAAGAGLDFKLSPSFTIGAGGIYKNYLSSSNNYSFSRSLYQGAGVYLSGRLQIGEGAAPDVRFKEIHTDPVFPIFFSFYDTNPFGDVLLENDSVNPIKNVRLSVFIPQYMDKPRVADEIKEIGSGKTCNLVLSTLFNDKILSVTEGAKVSMELTLDYEYAGKPKTYKQVETLEILYRNAITWDDDRKAASFVTAKDPAVLKFSKNVVSALRDENSFALNKNFRYAVGIFEALGVYGISYIIDPNSSYIELSKDNGALDYLQFPAQTLSYKAGDCDDLSILYSALLESIGIETAFITIPGHIYMAFSPELSQKEASRIFTNVNDLVFIDDKTWIPVEITLMQDGFVKAWRVGAKEWRENNKNGTAKFYSMHDSWTVYDPVGSPGEVTEVNLPEISMLKTGYRNEFNRFVQNEINEKVTNLKKKIQSSSNKKRYRNALGVLYARYGFLSDASEQLKTASDEGSVPAMINLANVYFLKADYSEALIYYKMAARRLPDAVSVLVGLARTNYKLDKQDEVRTAYMKIEKKNPDVADKYAFLVSGGSGTSRAAEADNKEIFAWEE